MTELEEAKQTLGTTSIRATIEQALKQVNRRAALARAAAAIEQGGLAGIVDPEELAALRRRRFEV
jgi:hypothetical protein